MRLARLEVSCVRNLSHVRIDLADGMNVFVGPNGAGKTSLLEAVYLLARGRSFRTSHIASVVQRGEPALTVRANVRDEHRGTLAISLHKRRDNVAEAQVNGVPERKQSDVAMLLPLQLFLPDGAMLVVGSPGERRRFLDWGVFHVKPSALATLRDYQRALRQRNAMLRSARGQSAERAPEIAAWSEQLAEIGTAVDALRRDYLNLLRAEFARQLARIAPDQSAELEYVCGWSEGEQLGKSLSESLARDVKFGVTHVGPHRADLRIRAGGAPVAEMLSRGQAKAMAVALRLAQAQCTMTVAGRRSIFLLDEGGAELDQTHARLLYEAIEDMDCQVMATANAIAAEWSGLRRITRLFHVEHGACQASA